MGDPLSYLSLAGGITLLAFISLDIIWTIFGEGGGPLTRRVTGLLWKLILRLHRSPSANGLLSAGGVLIVILAIALWVAGFWTAWFLIFNADPLAVVHSRTRLPADAGERLYFTGMTIFTLGTGDFIANGDIWRFLMALASFSGFSLITASLTYAVPLIQAVSQKRQLAVLIGAVGVAPQEILVHTWNGKGFPSLQDHLHTLMPLIAQTRQHHLTYPVLHYLHSSSHVESSPLRIAALDEALSILDCAVQRTPDVFDPALLLSSRQTITEFLDVISNAYIQPADKAPPTPDLDPLRRVGIPVVADAGEVRRRYMHLENRRKLLLGLVTSDGWRWEELEPRRIESDGLRTLGRKG